MEPRRFRLELRPEEAPEGVFVSIRVLIGDQEAECRRFFTHWDWMNTPPQVVYDDAMRYMVAELRHHLFGAAFPAPAPAILKATEENERGQMD